MSVVPGAVVAMLCMVVALSSPRTRPLAIGIAGMGTILFGWFAIGGVPIAAALLAAALLVRPNGVACAPLSRVAVLCAILFSIAFTSILWSPSIQLALGAASGWLAIAIATAVGRYVVADIGTLRKATRLLALPLVALAVTVLAFRWSPGLEGRYYRSDMAQFFLGSTGAVLYRDDQSWNNTVELGRAAGYLFVNVNRSSMVLGVAALVVFAVSLRTASRLLACSALVMAAAVAATGSKTGMALLGAALAILLAARVARAQRDAAARGVTKLLAAGTIALAAHIVLRSADGFVASSQTSLTPRRALWSEAVRAIEEQWLAGLGFGGWQDRWSTGAVQLPFETTVRPVHNWLLQAWLDGGLLYVVPHLLFASVALLMAWRAWRSASSGGPLDDLAFALAPVWVVVHGIGDNTPLYGDMANVVMLGLAFSAGAHAQGRTNRPSRRPVTPNHRQPSQVTDFRQRQGPVHERP